VLWTMGEFNFSAGETLRKLSKLILQPECLLEVIESLVTRDRHDAHGRADI